MIDLNHRFCLLENGSIEPLWYSNNEPRDAYQDEDGYYLNHDEYINLGDRFMIAYVRDKIIQTSNSIAVLQTTELWQKTHKREVTQ